MMISPDTYIDERKNKSYKKLIIEWDKLLKDIYNYENSINNKTINIDNMVITEPDPYVRYQCNLLYLSKLLILIKDKYKEEYELNQDK